MDLNSTVAAERVIMDSERIQVGDKAIEVWPRDQQFRVRGQDVKNLRTTFTDIDDYHPGLLAEALERAADPRYSGQYSGSLGGTKLYHLEA